MKERGEGHYKFINEVMYTLFQNDLTDKTRETKAKLIETQMTMNYIINYIVNVLQHFTKFRADGSLNLRHYLDNVFIKIVDIWGFIFTYYPLVELLGNNYSVLSENELKIFNKLKYIFISYLFEPRNEEIEMDKLYSDLEDLGNLINKTKDKSKKDNVTGSKKNTFSKLNKSSKSSKSIKSIKSNKSIKSIKSNKSNKSIKSIKSIKSNKSSISFKRISKKSIFKKPFLIDLK
jgi:hypothetical protein